MARIITSTLYKLQQYRLYLKKIGSTSCESAHHHDHDDGDDHDDDDDDDDDDEHGNVDDDDDGDISFPT